MEAQWLVQGIELFGRTVAQTGDDDWGRPTPCTDWNVRELVNHVTVEDLWAERLFGGATIEEVGSDLDGDQLGVDPHATWDATASAASAAATRDGAMTDTVHLSFGDFPGSEYAMQLFADHVVHSWDLAVGIGADTRLPADLVDAVLPWFAEREELYRQSGAIGPRPELPPDADPQTRLLAMFGRTG